MSVFSKSFLKIGQIADFSKYNSEFSYPTACFSKRRTEHGKPLLCVLCDEHPFVQKKKRKGRIYCHSVQLRAAIIFAVRARPVVTHCMISGPLGTLVKGFMLCCSNRIIKMLALAVIEALLHLQNNPPNENLLRAYKCVYLYVSQQIEVQVELLLLLLLFSLASEGQIPSCSSAGVTSSCSCLPETAAMCTNAEWNKLMKNN